MTRSLINLLSNRVLPEEIDDLGHLSVPFYEARALTASRQLAEDLGCRLGDYSARGVEFILVDAYLRNLREQFLDAPLTVRGGVLKVSPTRLRFYQELINSEQDVLAATFVQEFELQPSGMGEAISFDDTVLNQATACLIDMPDHGQPRSLDLSRSPHNLTLAQAQTLGLSYTAPRSIDAQECNETGLFLGEHFTSLPYAGFGDDEMTMEWVFETEDGRTLGIADLESRNVLFSLPRVGEQIQVYSANVSIGTKVFQRSHWVFNLNSQALISAAMTVSLPLDLQARRSTPIPPEMLANMEGQYHPQLF